MMIEDILIEINPLVDETVKLTIPMFSPNLNTIHQCLKRNVAKDNLKVKSLLLTKDNKVIIVIGGIEGVVSEFLNLIQTEISIAVLMPIQGVKEKIENEMRKLLQSA